MSVLRTKGTSSSDLLGTLKILLLDDDRFERKRLIRWGNSIRSVKAEFVEVGDLEQFQLALDRDDFDLVVVDVRLADGDGFDALERLFKNQRNSGTYTIMISGQDVEKASAQAMAMGCDRFIEKSSLNQFAVRQIFLEAGGATAQTAEIAGLPPISSTQHWATRAKRRDPRSSAAHTLAADSESQNGFTVKLWPGAADFFAEFRMLDSFQFPSDEMSQQSK